MIDKYLKNYTCMKSLIEVSVLAWDKIADTQETVSVDSINKKSQM